MLVLDAIKREVALAKKRLLFAAGFYASLLLGMPCRGLSCSSCALCFFAGVPLVVALVWRRAASVVYRVLRRVKHP